MKNYISILSAVVFSLCITACVPEDNESPVKEMTVTMTATSLDLPFNAEKNLSYTVADASGDVKVTVSGLPSAISCKTAGDRSGGTLTFTSTLDEDKTVDARVSFSDSRTTVTRDLKLNTQKKPQTFSVNLTSETVTIVAGTPSGLNYSTAAAAGDVTVTLQDAPKSIWVENAYDKAKETGTLTFNTSLDDESSHSATLVFNDTKTSVSKTISIQITVSTKAPDKPQVDADDNVIYPAETGHATEFPFTISCDSSIGEVSVSSTSGIKAEVSTTEDRKSGKVTVTATDGMTDKESFTLKAANTAGESSTTVNVTRAFLELDSSSADISYQETKGSFKVNSNLEYAVKSEEEFISASKDGETVSFTVKENPEWETRTGRIAVSDSKGILTKTFTVSQEMTHGSHESDLEALMAIYESLNMKEWEERGSFGYYYSNWGRMDITPDYWAGVAWNSSMGRGRVRGLGFTGPQPNSTGIFPEELGHLTELIELSMGGAEVRPPLPNSIKNLLKLKELTCACSEHLVMALDDWTGLKELVLNKNNRLRDVNMRYCNLYGPVPEWVGEGNIAWLLGHNHLSGQIPDKVAKNEAWNAYVTNITVRHFTGPEYTNSQFDPSKYELSDDGSLYLDVPILDYMIYTQEDNYALWIGERPANTKFVNDEHGGHWEWTD